MAKLIVDDDVATTLASIKPAPYEQQVGPAIGVNAVADAAAIAKVDPAAARKILTQAAAANQAKTDADIAAITPAVTAQTQAVEEAAAASTESNAAYSASEDAIIAAVQGLPADMQSQISTAAGGTMNVNLNLDPLIALQKQQAEAARKDAFKLLEDTFNQYGLGDLASSIQSLMKSGVGPYEAALMLKTDPAYNGPYLKRFAGNVQRQKAGLNALSEAEYISLENQYTDLMSAYGVKKLATRDEFANLIGNDVSPTEVNKRLDLAVYQVQNADPNIKAMLQQYYPQLKDSDLMSYMLNPEKTLPALQEMVTAGQIGAAAMQQPGLEQLSAQRATELARLGVDQAAARTGFEKVATVLPTGQKLSQIYGEAAIPYTQTTAEQEFLQGNASAARKRKQLAALEEASFSGRSGVDVQVSPLARSIQGKF